MLFSSVDPKTKLKKGNTELYDRLIRLYCLETKVSKNRETKQKYGSFSCADKPAKKHCWLICCERKILFRLKKNKLKKTDYKPDEHALYVKTDCPVLLD
jgi:hypothetical protein